VGIRVRMSRSSTLRVLELLQDEAATSRQGCVSTDQSQACFDADSRSVTAVVRFGNAAREEPLCWFGESIGSRDKGVYV